MFKRKKVIFAVLVFLVLFIGAIGYGVLFSSREGDIRITGNLDEKDLKQIKGLVLPKIRSKKVEHVWNMVLDLDLRRIPERVQEDRGFRVKYIRVRTNGEVNVDVMHDDIDDGGWTYVLNRTNGWRIVGEEGHSP